MNIFNLWLHLRSNRRSFGFKTESQHFFMVFLDSILGLNKPPSVPKQSVNILDFWVTDQLWFDRTYSDAWFSSSILVYFTSILRGFTTQLPANSLPSMNNQLNNIWITWISLNNQGFLTMKSICINICITKKNHLFPTNINAICNPKPSIHLIRFIT